MARIAIPQRRSPAAAMPDVVLALLRRLRGDWATFGTVFGVVLITSLVFAAIPTQFNSISDDGLRYAVERSRPFLRNIQMTRADRIGAEGSLAAIDQEGQRFQDELAPSIQSVIGHRTFVYDAPRYVLQDPPGQSPFPFPRYITMRYQSEIEQHITLVQGRMPAPTTERVPVTMPGRQADAQLVEIAISPETARQLSTKIGDRFVMAPDNSDALMRGIPASSYRLLAVEIVGLIEPQDLDDDFWLADPRLDRAVEYDDGSTVHIYAYGLMSADVAAYLDVLVEIAPAPINYSWRYFVEAERFDAGKLDQLASDVRKLDAEYRSTGFARPTDTSVRTGLSQIFQRYLAQRALTENILSLATIGLLAVALAVIGLVAALGAERRRESIALLRSRGGSTGQVLGAQAVEGFLLALPAALIGYAIASLLVDGRASDLSRSLALGIVVATTLLMVLANAPLARRNLQALERGEVVVTKTAPRRVVMELMVVALAVLGVYLLRRRGIAGDSAAAEETGFDVYLAAVPVLLGLAVGLFVLRVYPLPIRALAWLASLRRDLVPVLGFKRVARQPTVTAVPLLVLLLAVAVGVFSSIMLHTIDIGQVRTSWQTVGADYRVDSFPGTPLYSGIDLSEVAAVEQIAEAYEQPDTSLVTDEPVFGRVTLLAVQPAKFAEVTEGTPADAHFPDALLQEPEGQDIGSPQNPIPAVVSRRWLSSRAIGIGDTFTLAVGVLEPTFVVRDIRETFPSLTVDQAFVVSSLDALRAMNPERPLRHNRLYISAPTSAFSELAETIDEQSNSGRLTSRAREYSEVHDAPLVSGTARGFQIGLLIAAVYSALAIIVALTLTERARARDLSFLRTLGMTNEQSIGLIAVELGPPVALAILVGIALGIASARLIEPGLDLTSFTGPEVPVSLIVDARATALLAVGLIAVVVGAVASAGWLARRANLAGALRLGDE